MLPRVLKDQLASRMTHASPTEADSGGQDLRVLGVWLVAQGTHVGLSRIKAWMAPKACSLHFEILPWSGQDGTKKFFKEKKKALLFI